MKVSIVTIGDELLIGQVIDTNSAWMGGKLNEWGAEIIEKISTSDGKEDIVSAIERSIEKSDLVLVTGGLGPTKDDITKKVLAEYFNTALVFHEPTWEKIQRLFKRWGRSTTEAHRVQCYMPQGAIILENRMGTAPGMHFINKGVDIISMPGVPYEMKYIMENGVKGIIDGKRGNQVIYHRTIRTVGEGESRIADRIAPITDNLPGHIKLAFLPSLGQVRLRLSGKGENKESLVKEVEAFSAKISESISEFVFGYDNQTLPEAIGELCKARNKKIGTAESCTGGRIAHLITGISGSSEYFMGSIIAYDNKVKKDLLSVKNETLEKHGAVSEEIVIEMAKGLLKALPIDVAVSVSGIAGPGGGTEEKPVGTIWMAVTDGNNTKTSLIRAGKDRSKNIDYAATYALNLIRKFLIGQE